MTLIDTAAGPVAVERLGRVLCHEHVFVLDPELQQNFPHEWGDEDRRIDDAVESLRQLHQAGIDTIIDPTVLGLGRYIPRIQRIARRVELNIVVATGWYTFDNLPMYFQARRPRSDGSDPLAERFIREIRHGIADTGVRPGVLKCASDRHGLTRDVARVMRAVATAHRATGVPIMTHTRASMRGGLDQVALFQECGVDLSRVLIGHCGDTDDLDYLEQLLQAGCSLGMDRFGLDGYLDTQGRIEVVARLCEQGYASQLMLSHDAGCYMDVIDGEDLDGTFGPRGDWNYCFLPTVVFPRLLERGVTREQLDQMTVANPQRFLASVQSGPY